jgi:hypothetical protein
MIVAAITSTRNADAGEHGRAGHRAHAFDPGAVIVDARRRRHLRHRLAQASEVERGAGLHARDDDARHRQLVDRQPLPSHGSSSLADSSLLNGLTWTMPGCVRIASAAAVTSRSRSRPDCGRTCR